MSSPSSADLWPFHVCFIVRNLISGQSDELNQICFIDLQIGNCLVIFMLMAYIKKQMENMQYTESDK